MAPLDYWLDRAEWYGFHGHPRRAAHCLRIAARCSPSLNVRLAISAAFERLMSCRLLDC